MKRQSEEWRKFELLVAQIEKQLAPKGAIIKSPDKIKDKVTGRMREVDASIRYQLDSEPLLITVECRKRGKKQDDTWIEQVVTKREKIGADRTIVVSEKGFSHSATLTAQHYGIVLRRIDDITDSEIADWIKKVTVEKIDYHDNILAFSIEVNGECDKFSQEIERKTAEAPFDSIILFQSKDDSGFSIRHLLQSVYSWREQGQIGDEVYTGITDSEGTIERKITVNLSDGEFYTYTLNGKAFIRKVEIDVETSVKRENVDLPKVYQYSDLKDGIAQIAEGAISVGPKGETYRIYVQPS